MNIRERLISAVTAYDARQAKGKYWNPHALPIYFERVDDVMADIAKGATLRAALCAGFSDRLLDHCLKAMGEKPFTRDELGHSICYTPASSK